jgi:hypothetical protein
VITAEWVPPHFNYTTTSSSVGKHTKIGEDEYLMDGSPMPNWPLVFLPIVKIELSLARKAV